MNRALAIGFLGVALIVVGMVRVDAAGPDIKIGFVDLERTLSETKAGKQANASFEKARKQKQAALDAKQAAFRKAAQELEKQKSFLKPEVLAKRQRKLEEMYIDIQETYAKLERDLAAERTKLIQQILQKAGPVIKQIAKKEGIHMVVDRSAVLWANDALDLTPQVNKRLR